jgi:pimeloyl-ACP methyl ester carboxylesterase
MLQEFLVRDFVGVLRRTVFAAVLVIAATTAAHAAPSYSTVAGANGVPLLVAQAGDPAAPGILFIHGMAQSHLAFHRQFEDPALTSRFHLVAFDLRGQGGSAKPWSPDDYRDSRLWADDVAAVIRATGLRRPLIVGWSYGGFVAMDYVRAFGTNDVAGIAMVGSLGGLVGMPRFSEGDSDAAKAMRARSAAQRSTDLQAFVTAGAETGSGYVAPAMTPLERQNFFATEIMTPAYVRAAMTGRNLNNGDLVERLSLPVMFFRGSKDVTMPQDGLQSLLERIRGSRLSAYDGVGHLPFMESTERFDLELAAFAIEAAAHGTGAAPSSAPAAARVPAPAASVPFAARATDDAATSPLVIGDTILLHSGVLNERRRINVYVPPGYGAANADALPVLYMLDGGLGEDFLHVAGLVQIGVANGTMRPVLLVGIENTERRRDLVGPTDIPEERKIAPHAGGTASFRRFLRTELMPYVRSHYRTTSETAVVGESFAGLFVLETFVHEPDLFDTYIAFDASVWWNGQRLLSDAERVLRRSDRAGKTVFLAASRDDIDDGNARFDRLLGAGAAAGVAHSFLAMPEERHATIYHPAALVAFRKVLAPRAPKG